MLNVIWESAYSATVYRQAQSWRGRAIAYLALVLTLCWAATLIRFQMSYSRVMLKAESAILRQVPVITFKDGAVLTPENKLYRIDVGTGTAVFSAIIDTTGQTKSLEGLSAQILLTRTKLFVRKQSGEIREVDFSKSKAQSFVLDHERIQKLMKLFRLWTVPFLAPFIILLSFLKRLVQGFFVALLGLAIVSILEVELDLGELFSLALVAMTPAMVLQTVAHVAGLQFRGSLALWVTMILGYFLFAINAASGRTPSDSSPTE